MAKKKKKKKIVAVRRAPGFAPVQAGHVTPTVIARNQIGTKQPIYKFGWVGSTLNKMADTRRWAWSFNPNNQIILTGTSGIQQPLLMIHTSPAEVLNAARLAVQGNSFKIISQAAWAGADLSLTLTGATVFGVRVRVTNSVLNFKYAAVNIRVLNGATLSSEIWVQTNQLPLDVMILTITNANGLASVVPITNPVVTFLLANNAGLVAGDIMYAESINMRDIGDIGNAGAPCALT
jgi:hypothetical protein